MAKQTINIGAAPNDGTGTPLRTSFDYTNQNFTELYTALGGGVGLPGSTTQVIFNDGGTNLAGDAGLTYNKTTDALTLLGTMTMASSNITGGTIPANGTWLPAANTLEFAANSLAQYRIAPLGVFSWYDGAGGTRMTLNSAGLGVPNALILGNRNGSYSYVIGGNTDLAWKKIADITIGTGLYTGVLFKVDVIDYADNVGYYASCKPMTFFATCRRSGGVLNDLNDAIVYGPVADYVRVAKTATGVYELQIRQVATYMFHSFVVEALTIAGGTVTYASGTPSNGSTSGTNYLPTPDWTQKLSNLSVAGTALLGVASANANGGVLQLKSGITFPATQVAATDVNTLDDYEEGTFTPTIVGGTTAGVGTYVVQNGHYTKVGNLVTFRLYVATSAHTGTGAMLINGLPFTSNGTGGQLYSVSIANLGGLTLTASNVAQAYINNGVNYISVAQYATGGGAASAVPICPVPYILVSGSYMV